MLHNYQPQEYHKFFKMQVDYIYVLWATTVSTANCLLRTDSKGNDSCLSLHSSFILEPIAIRIIRWSFLKWQTATLSLFLHQVVACQLQHKAYTQLVLWVTIF